MINASEQEILEATTLIEMMRLRAFHTPDKRAFLFGEETFTFSELWINIERMASHYQELGARPGDRIIIVLPNGPEFFAAFYGAQRISAIAVPIFPGSGPERIADYAKACSASIISLTSTIDGAIHRDIGKAVGDLGVVITNNEKANTQPLQSVPEPQPGDIAFLQYTSGSTGSPKGVRLSHKNLLTNMAQMIAGMEITSQDRFVSWLPVCHDMGLILKTIVPFYLGAELVLLESAIANPLPWLRAIEEHKATFTAAPDFAYRLALRRSFEPLPNLSSLRVALNAAEPVRIDTIREFEKVFGLKNVMMGAYGLAEATVGVSMMAPGAEARVDSRGIVSVGKPFPDVELGILKDGQFAPTKVEGEILIRSTANCGGYFDDAEATSKLFREDGFFYTGDAGFLDDNGFLYITGRLKNIIIVGGRNIAPQEVEEAADASPRVRFSAALGIDRHKLAGEQMYVFAEVKLSDDPGKKELDGTRRSIVRQIHSRLGLRPAQVHLLAPGTIPMTHNGKVQHQALKDGFLNGTIKAYIPDQ